MPTASHEIKKLFRKNNPNCSLRQFARTLNVPLVEIWFNNKRGNTRIKPEKIVKNEERKKNLPPARKR